MVTKCCSSRKYFKMNGNPICMNKSCINYLSPTRIGFGMGMIRSMFTQISQGTQPPRMY